MVEEGLLTAIRGPHIDGSSIWSIDKRSAEALTDQLAPLKVKTPFLRMTRFDDAVKVLSCHDFSTAKLIKAILDQSIPIFWLTNKISDSAICADDLTKLCLQARQGRSQISRKQFAEMMGVKRTHIIDTWIERGLISIHEMSGDTVWFGREDVLTFIHNHIWTEEASKIMQVGVLTVQKWARAGRLHPVSGREIDGLHRYLFRQDEIERFKPENRLTAPQVAKKHRISRAQLNQWIMLGKVKPISGPGIDGCGQYLFLESFQSSENQGKNH